MSDDLERETDPRQLTPNTCWILGAGASFDCFSEGEEAVPLTRNLIGNIRDSFIIQPEAVNRVERLLSMCDETKDVDLQDAFGTHIEITFDVVRGLCDHEDASVSTEAKTSLRELTATVAEAVSKGQFGGQVGRGEIMIRRRTEDDPPRDKAIFMGDIPENYGWLVMGCIHNPNWAIVTLNFDSVLDWVFRLALSEQASALQFTRWMDCLDNLVAGETKSPEGDHGGYVKLHGTFDLYSCHNPLCEAYRQPYIEGDRQEPNTFTVLVTATRNCPKCGGDALPLILPPGRNKVKGEGAYHDMVNRMASMHLGAADTWVVLGYSCPEYDRDVTELLCDAMERCPSTKQKRSIVVISPDCLDVGNRMAEQLAMSDTAARFTIQSIHPMKMTFTEMVDNISRRREN